MLWVANKYNMFRLRDFLYYCLSLYKHVDKRRLSVNCFYNQNYFSYPSYSQEFSAQNDEITSVFGKEVLVRVLFYWNDNVQPKRDGKIDFSFYDDILKFMPEHMRCVVVLSGCPSFVRSESSRFTRLDLFSEYCNCCIEHFGANPKVIGFQIGNEINSDIDGNNYYEFPKYVENYVYVAQQVRPYIERVNKKFYMAATTSILQNYPKTLLYNRGLLKYHQKLNLFDVFCIHWYGDSWFSIFTNNGVLNFIDTISLPISITELGHDSPKHHVKYFRRNVPFLFAKIENLLNIFWYQYDGGGETSQFGLRRKDGVSPLMNYIKNL
jgi:hypothetical protein